MQTSRFQPLGVSEMRSKNNNNCSGIRGESQPLENVRISPHFPQPLPSILPIPLIWRFFHNLSNCILLFCLFIFVWLRRLSAGNVYFAHIFVGYSCKLVETSPHQIPSSPSQPKFLSFNQIFDDA